MRKQRALRTAISCALLLALIIGSSAIFISQMNRMVNDTTLNSVQEIAVHDRISIENYLERSWLMLTGIYERLVIYGCSTISAAQEQMGLERSTCEFHTLYLIADDGTVYNDRYAVFPREEMDILSYLDSPEERIACRYDYETTSDEKKEMLMYAVRLDDYELEGVRFTHLVGITPINQIEEHMAIYSFYKDGRSRGYTVVINPSGDFIVDPLRTVSLNTRDNLYDLLDRGRLDPGWTHDSIRAAMGAGSSFQVTYVDHEGVSRFLFFTPVNGVEWYLVTSVEQAVFTELTRAFVFSSTSMVAVALALTSFMLFMFVSSRRKELAASADAKARSEFLSNMSHEIRTPLNGITGLLHLMETHLADGDTAQMVSWIQKARSTAQYLLSLVSDILDMSKLQAGKLNLTREPFLLDAALDSIETMQRENALSHDIELTFEAELPTPCIVGDEVRLKQVLMNIVGNAVKFTPAGGSIHVKASQKALPDGRAATTIVCTDTGVGMSLDFQKHIWDSFSQEHNSVSDGTRGTGLGMTISKGIIDAMGGTISVESRLGEGSAFTVVIYSEVGEPPASPAPASPDTDGGGPLKLLVAEDNELNAEILLDILRDEGCEAVWAQDGAEAVEFFTGSALHEFDAVLMDMQMPVMDGCQAAEAIRSLPREDAASIVIFACTANSFQEDRESALASGMNDFLTKPIDIAQLIERLAALRRRKVERE